MADQPTQKATQPIDDANRNQNQPMLSEEDEGDVICILHPASIPACHAVELIAEATPQHILTRPLKDIEDDLQYDNPKDQSPTSPDPVGLQKETVDDRTDPGTSHDVALRLYDDSKGQHPTTLRSVGSRNEPADERTDQVTNSDIALRLSSRLRDPCMGFVFGRDVNSCDLMLSREPDYQRRISKSHFRMFFNHLGVLMLEDTSTNGTVVNGEVLKSGGEDKKRMIAGGEAIEILLGGHHNHNGFMRFIVTIPTRNNPDNRFAHNLDKYIAWRDQEVRRAEVLAQAAVDGRPQMNPAVVCKTTPLQLFED